MKTGTFTTQRKILLLAILLLTIASSSSCKKEKSQNPAENAAPTETKKITAVVIFAVGDVYSQDHKLSLGDIITDAETLTTGKKSLCDIQIVDSDSGIVVRIKAESEFKLEPSVNPDGNDINLALKKGSGLFKINNKLGKNQSVKVSMPTMVAGVRGTSFVADISKKGDVELQVIEGSVSSRPAIAEIDSLPTEVKSNSQAIQAVETSLEGNEQVLDAGKKITISKAYTDKILKDSGLKEVIPQIQDSIKKGDMTAATLKIDSMSGTSAETKSKITEKLANQAPIKVENSKDKDLQAQIKEFEELIAIESKKMENESSRKTEISARNKEKKDSLMKRIEQITGKSVETLLLKNGTRVQGVIIQEGDVYHVLTTEGKKSFPESEVEGTEF
jgi:hypothetical protein